LDGDGNSEKALRAPSGEHRFRARVNRDSICPAQPVVWLPRPLYIGRMYPSQDFEAFQALLLRHRRELVGQVVSRPSFPGRTIRRPGPESAGCSGRSTVAAPSPLPCSCSCAAARAAWRARRKRRTLGGASCLTRRTEDSPRLRAGSTSRNRLRCVRFGRWSREPFPYLGPRSAWRGSWLRPFSTYFLH
jgi:hypothetical protein